MNKARMIVSVSLLLVGVVGCADSGSGGTGGSGGGGGSAPDAAHDGPMHDGQVSDAQGDGYVPAACPPGPAGTVHTIFASFDGVTLHAATGLPDSRTNRTPLVTRDTVVPQFRPSDVNRTAIITSIVADLQLVLSSFNVDVVTTRPSSGNYIMAVFGGTPTLYGAEAGTAGLGLLDCSNQNTNDIVVILEFATGTDTDFASVTLNEIGHSIGLDVASAPAGDCMYQYVGEGLCSLGTSVTAADTPGCRPSGSAQDDTGAFAAAFGCR